MWHNEVLGTFKGMKYFDASKFKWDSDSDHENENLPTLEEIIQNEDDQKNVISHEEEESETKGEVPENDDKNEDVPHVNIIVEANLDFAPQPPMTSRKAPPAPLRAKSKLRPSTSAVTRGDIFDQKLRESNQAFQQFMEQLQNSENALNEKLMQRMALLVEKQKEELRNHDFDWKFGNHAKFYNRESQNLRALKQQYEMMLKLNLSDEAEEIRKIYDRERIVEQRENKKAHTKAFLESRHKLEMKHAQERQLATNYADEKRMVFNAIQNQNSQSFLRRQAILRNTINKKQPKQFHKTSTRSNRILYKARIHITDKK